MATPTTISWDYVPGSSGTKVEYKLHSSPTWITPSSPANPTNLNNYPLVIADDVYYDVRLTTVSDFCASNSITLQIIHPGTTCCPIGYTLSTDETYCYQTSITDATPPSSPENTIAETLDVYGTWGTLIYNPGYSTNGVGTFTQIPYSNTFWVNGLGYPASTGDLTDSPLNRSGLWASTTLDNQDVGFTVCINAPVDGTYYVGTGVDNYSTIKIDGNIVMQMDASAMAIYLNANGYPGAIGEVVYRFWHIYPITLTAGDHVVEVIAHNISGPAALGAEIYSSTASELVAATSYADIGSGLIFSTKDFIGQPVQVGSGGIGYSCPAGYSLVLCDGPAYCTQTLTTSLVPCT